MPVDHGVGDGLGESVELAGPHRILEARERGLGGQPVARDRRSSHEHLVDRIVGEHAGVVAVGMAQCDGEHPLPQNLDQLVLHLAGLTAIAQAVRQLRAQPQPFVDGLQQQATAIGAAMGLIEGRHNGLRNQLGKKNRLCCRLGHAEGPWMCMEQA